MRKLIPASERQFWYCLECRAPLGLHHKPTCSLYLPESTLVFASQTNGAAADVPTVATISQVELERTLRDWMAA